MHAFCRCLVDKYNIEAVDLLIRAGLVNMTQYDTYLGQAIPIDESVNRIVLNFAMQLVQKYCIDEKIYSQVWSKECKSSATHKRLSMQ